MEILEFCERKNNILIGRLVRAGLLRNHNVCTVLFWTWSFTEDF